MRTAMRLIMRMPPGRLRTAAYFAALTVLPWPSAWRQEKAA